MADLARRGEIDPAAALYAEIFGVGTDEALLAVQRLSEGKPVAITRTAVPASAQASQVFTVEPSPLVIEQKEVTRRVAGVTAATVGGISCVSLAALVIILGVTIIPIFFALLSPGGPWEMIGARLNPFAFARVEFSFGAEGSGAGLFDEPRGIAVDPAGNLFIANYSDGRVQKFDSSGNYQLLWNIGAEQYVKSMTADRDGNIFMVYRGDIWKYRGANGQLIAQIQHPEGKWIGAIAATADGGIVAAVSTEDIVRYDAGGEFVWSLPNTSEDADGVEDLAVDGVGNIYVLTDSESVIVLSPAGRLLSRFGSSGDEPGQLRAVGAIAVDGQSRIYVSDIKGIQVYQPDGRYLDLIDVPGYAFGMEFDSKGTLWVVSNEPAVIRYRIVKK
jgi:sugar lactone lactonase YvrE